MDESYLDEADEADALADAIEQAEDLERFFRRGGPGATLLAKLRDGMVDAHLSLPFLGQEESRDQSIRIAAYRLLINMVKQELDQLAELRNDIAASDSMFMRRVMRRDETPNEDA